MKKIKVAILVSGGGTNLQAIIDYAKAGNIPHAELALVLSSNADAFALERASIANIETAVVARRKYPDNKEFEKNILMELKNHEIEMIVLAGFMSILSPEFVAQYPNRIINIHPSLIPAFCGKGFYGIKVHEAAIDYGVKVSGATVHFVNEVPDGGRIILQKSVMIRKGETAESLQTHVMRNAEWLILPRSVEMVCKMIIKGGDLEE